MFSVNLEVRGINLVSDPDADQEIALELSLNTYLANPLVSWSHDEPGILLVSFDTDGITEESAKNGSAEELFEIAYASLFEVIGLNVKVTGIHKK